MLFACARTSYLCMHSWAVGPRPGGAPVPAGELARDSEARDEGTDFWDGELAIRKAGGGGRYAGWLLIVFGLWCIRVRGWGYEVVDVETVRCIVVAWNVSRQELRAELRQSCEAGLGYGRCDGSWRLAARRARFVRGAMDPAGQWT